MVAFEKDELIASGYLVENEIGGIYVHPGKHHKGIGQKMLHALLLEAENQKLSSVWLESTPIARKLYENSGFEVVEEKIMYVKNNTPLPYFFMQKNL